MFVPMEPILVKTVKILMEAGLVMCYSLEQKPLVVVSAHLKAVMFLL